MCSILEVIYNILISSMLAKKVFEWVKLFNTSLLRQILELSHIFCIDRKLRIWPLSLNFYLNSSEVIVKIFTKDSKSVDHLNTFLAHCMYHCTIRKIHKNMRIRKSSTHVNISFCFMHWDQKFFNNSTKSASIILKNFIEVYVYITHNNIKFHENWWRFDCATRKATFLLIWLRNDVFCNQMLRRSSEICQ